MFLPPVNIPVSRLCYSSHFFRLTCYLSSSTYWSIRSLWSRSTFVIFVLYRVQHCLCSHTLERCFSSLSVCSQILSHCSLSIQSRNLVLIRMTHLPFAEKRHQAKIFLFFVYFFQNNKNSLTKTSFSLFWLFTAEDEKKNKKTTKQIKNKQTKPPKRSCPFHLLLALFPPRSSLSTLLCRLDKRVPGPIAVSLTRYTGYSMIGDTLNTETSLTFALGSFAFCSELHRTWPVHVYGR